jgi:hypothetical protein
MLIEQRVESFKDKRFVFRFDRLVHFILLCSQKWEPSLDDDYDANLPPSTAMM